MDLPACGLFRTTIPHPDKPDAVPAGRLVYFHNHSHAEVPVVILPMENTANKWVFRDGGYLVRTPGWVRSLQPLKAEGFYLATQPFQTPKGWLVPSGQIVQLGYNGSGEPLVFFPRRDAETNSLVFPPRGMKAPRAVYDALQPLSIRGPYEAGREVN